VVLQILPAVVAAFYARLDLANTESAVRVFASNLQHGALVNFEFAMGSDDSDQHRALANTAAVVQQDLEGLQFLLTECSKPAYRTAPSDKGCDDEPPQFGLQRGGHGGLIVEVPVPPRVYLLIPSACHQIPVTIVCFGKEVAVDQPPVPPATGCMSSPSTQNSQKAQAVREVNRDSCATLQRYFFRARRARKAAGERSALDHIGQGM
jgi:hypothetical protein